MQCHGGLKGPLRRIIRSLGNDRVGSSCRSYPQRHLSGRRATSSPPQRCSPARDTRPGAPAEPNGRFLRGYGTESFQTVSHSDPEPKEGGQNGLQNDRHDRLGLAPPEASSTPLEEVKEPSLNDSNPETVDPPPDRVVIRRYLTDAPIKDTHQFSERYRANFRKVFIGHTRNRLKAHQMQQDRHDYASSDDWRVILRMLDDQTTAGHELYRKKLETVTLPKGVVARFNNNAGASLKEIMEHTGCHVQIARGVSHCSSVPDAFAGLDLLGSSWQITDALKILPQYLDVMPTEEAVGTYASRDLNDHAIERRVRSDEDARLAVLSQPDIDHQQEHDSLDEGDVELVENELDEKAGGSASVTTPIRAVWAEDRTRKLNMFKLLDERPKSFSNSLEVSAYVADLCQPVPRLIHQAIYKTRMPFHQRERVQFVKEKLIFLFSTPGVARMATSYTVDRAIRFLTKYNNMAAFRELYDALEDGGYVFTASNWNCCLAAAAKVGDVHNFKYTLKVMLRHRVKPNPTTWVILHDLICRRFPRETGFVLETMRNKGLLLDHNAAKLVAQNAVSNDLKRHLALKGDLRTFFRLYDNRFSSSYGLEGFNWLTVDVVNRMATVLLSLGRSHDAFEVLSEFHRRKGQTALETATLNTFLTSSLRDMDPASAVAILEHFRVGQPGALIPNNVTYTILFAIAWRRRYFNMLRVIWRYACANGQIGFSMRYRMKMSLNFFLPQRLGEEQVKSRGQVWRALAAKFAVGISGGLRHYKDNTDLKDERLNPLETQLLQSVSQGDLRNDSPLFEGRKNFLRHALTDDFTEAGVSRPVLPFAELLKSAWEKDRDWKKRGLGLPRNYSEGAFLEMLADGIKVPMKAGDGTVETRAWEVPAMMRQAPKAEEKEDDEGEGPVISKYAPIV